MKTLNLTIALLAATVAGFAQNNNTIDPPEPIMQSKFSVGPRGGFGHSFMIPYNDNMFTPSWDAGISAIYAPGNHWGVQLDALYSKEGVDFEQKYNSETNTFYSINSRLDYIRIPIKAVYFFRKYEKDFRPKVSLGPTLGILVLEQNSTGAQGIDVGANATVGFNYRLARAVWLNMDVNYYQGFVDVFKGNNETDLNGNIRLDIGLSFGF